MPFFIWAKHDFEYIRVCWKKHHIYKSHVLLAFFVLTRKKGIKVEKFKVDTSLGVGHLSRMTV